MQRRWSTLCRRSLMRLLISICVRLAPYGLSEVMLLYDSIGDGGDGEAATKRSPEHLMTRPMTKQQPAG